MEKIFIEEIKEGQRVASAFLLSDLRLGQTKSGRPFVGLKLSDRTGRLEARVWDGAEAFFDHFSGGDVAFIEGAADSYNNQVQVKINSARLLEPDQVDPAHYLASSPFDSEEMFSELKDLIGTMKDPHLQGLLMDVLEDEDLASRFKKAPAAKRFHHAYVGGLLEHVLSITRTASVVAGLYPVLNRDLLMAGAVLHDLGKIREFDQGLSGDYTDEGRLLGHLIIGIEIVESKLAGRPDFPPRLAMLVKHLIASHHGEYEMGSPRKPKILEALALHLLDDLDAKMNGLGSFIDRHVDERTGWTDYNNLMARFFHRPAPFEWLPPEEGFSSEEPEEVPEPVEAEVEPEEEPPRPQETVARGGDQTPAEDGRRRDQLSLLGE